MTSMAACALAVLASLLALASLARGTSPRRRLRALLALAPGVAMMAVGSAQVAIWMGATLVLGWVVAAAAGRTQAAGKET